MVDFQNKIPRAVKLASGAASGDLNHVQGTRHGNIYIFKTPAQLSSHHETFRLTRNLMTQAEEAALPVRGQSKTAADQNTELTKDLGCTVEPTIIFKQLDCVIDQYEHQNCTF